MHVLGIMVGSSLDGVDFTLCSIEEKSSRWSYRFVSTHTAELDHVWKEKILSLRETGLAMPIEEQIDVQFALYLSKSIKDFVDNLDTPPEMIVFHGPTVAHQPKNKISLQLGSGLVLANQLGIPVLSNLRQSDIDLGGEGAPFAPILDEYFFNDYDYCINIGGIVNVSFIDEGLRRGYDLCGGNQVLDFFAKKAGISFDMDGNLAAQGALTPVLLRQYNSWDYLDRASPKSLSNLAVSQHYIKTITENQYHSEDILRTMIEHICQQTLMLVNNLNLGRRILITGGGAKNKFLIQRLRTLSTENEWIVPEDELIDHKEGLLLCLMGYLFLNHKVNVLGSVTGASSDSIAGQLFKPIQNG